MAVVPYNQDAEDSIISACITRPDYIRDIAPDLTDEHFYNPRNGRIWHEFVKTYDKNGVGPDANQLADACNLPLADITEYIVNSAFASRATVDILMRDAASRKFISKANNIINELKNGGDPYEIANDMEKFTTGIGISGTNFEQEAVTIEQLMSTAELVAPTIIPGMANRDYRTVVVAEEGAGKSLLLRTIAMCTAQGIHPFSHRLIEPKRALIVDLENPAQSILDTAVKLQKQLERQSIDFDPERLRIWRKPGGINIRRLSDKAALQREIMLHEPELVCIGPIYKMYQRKGGESYEDSADEAMAALDDLRTRHNFALFMEHHAAKGKQGESRDLSPMGSQRWMAWPEIGISLYRNKEDPTQFDVKRFRGDRLSGVTWPDKITRNLHWLVDGFWYDGVPN